MHAVVLAGGKGVRLRPYTTCLPKPLVPLGDDDVIIDVILGQLARQGFTTVTLAINHLGHLIEAYVGDGSKWGLSVSYAHETSPLGTFGPLVQIQDELPDHFLVVNGDILTDLQFSALLDSHIRWGSPLTVATYTAESRVEFGVLDIEDSHIHGFTEKPSISYHVSMGIYGVSRSVLQDYAPGVACGADQIILDMLQRGDHPASYPFSGLWRDIGRPADYDEVNAGFTELRGQLFPVLQAEDRRVSRRRAAAAALASSSAVLAATAPTPERTPDLLPAVGV